MFESLSERLGRAVRQVTGRGHITEENVRDTVRQIRVALLEADVALPVVRTLVNRVRERASGHEVARSLNPGQVFVKIVHDELVSVLGGDARPIAGKGRPAVLMLVGLQGAGKTTTAGKLVPMLAKRSNGEILLASTDVYRPAAREQLGKLAAQLGAGLFDSGPSDPAAIAVEARAEAARLGCRWLILDTAGRLHIDEALMAEARSIHSAVAPDETLFVLDAMAGQDAVNSAGAFNDALPLTGVILTKADGDARGGAALSVREVTGLPIKLIGTGEKLDALEPFVPDRFASRILGMGDVVGLVEQVESRVDRESVERMARKVKRGRELNLADFREQLKQLRQLGGFDSVLDKLPGIKPGALAAAGLDDRVVGRQIALIDSMTPRERRHPATIDGSRKRRIARGAGLAVQDVNRLLKQHRRLAKAMKQAAKGGMNRVLAQAVQRKGGHWTGK
ncbi:signal recognition particle protein [Candidatus Rariloculus sp.]|uniref:signal recognition particle protein n=1 Tax=Candidatus Rariloculus sp. TaxID=3101265 RepID=UPI003D0D1B8F